MIRKVVKPWNEVQLGFTFFVEEEASSPVVRDRETGKAQKSREAKPTPDNLRDAIALTQSAIARCATWRRVVAPAPALRTLRSGVNAST